MGHELTNKHRAIHADEKQDGRTCIVKDHPRYCLLLSIFTLIPRVVRATIDKKNSKIDIANIFCIEYGFLNSSNDRTPLVKNKQTSGKCNTGQ